MAASMHQVQSPVPFCTELPVALGTEEAPSSLWEDEFR